MQSRFHFRTLALVWACFWAGAAGQADEDGRRGYLDSSVVPSRFRFESSLASESGRSEMGEQDPMIWSSLADESPREASGELGSGPPRDWKALMRPVINGSSEWITGGEWALSNHDLRVTVPTYPLFGPPPPLLTVGMAYTHLEETSGLGLPTDWFSYSLGMSWVQVVNERWKVRSTVGVAWATDHRNRSSESWQFRGGMFGIYEPNERWQWLVGGLALGRQDLPFVPALGVIWQPTPAQKYDFTFPRPRFSRLIHEHHDRQQWVYLGMELGGNTWGYETVALEDELFTYSDWRAVIGWESVPAAAPGALFVPGRRIGLEAGYVFAREYSLAADAPEQGLANAWILGLDLRF